MIQDFRFAFRQLLKSPGFTFIAVVTLALAIGVNSAIFALINGVVLRPMVPVRPQEVVNVFTARQSANHDYRQFSYTEFRELRENSSEVFTDLAALEFAVAGIGSDHEMRRSFAFLTSENFFSMMGNLETGKPFPYPGRIITVVHPSDDGQDGRVRIEFYAKPAPNPNPSPAVTPAPLATPAPRVGPGPISTPKDELPEALAKVKTKKGTVVVDVSALTSRRLEGIHGTGDAKLELASFSGTIHLQKQ